ncbi:MAG: fimbrial protein [Tannerellaceae bacterium]|nr:fimbrial protein [Tannerellaceae bacterium]
MNITKTILFATVLSVLFISCEKENIVETESAATRVAEEEKEIGYVSVYLEDPTSIMTRAGEYKIHNLSFFVFDENGVRDAGYGYQTFSYTGSQYTFVATPGENKTIIAVANLQHLGDMQQADLETVQRAIQRVMSQKPGEIPATGTAMAAQSSGIHIQKKIQVIKMTLSSF